MVESTDLSGKPTQKTQKALLAGAADPSGWSQSFIDRLSDTDREALNAIGHREQYPSGSVIFREGEPGDSLYIVWAGRVAALKEESDGRSTLLAYRGPGEIVGEMSVVGNRARSASVVAVEDTDLLCIQGDDFQSLLGEHTCISQAILDVLSDRLQAADTARTAVVREEQNLTRQLERLTTETNRLAELARLRQETIDLIIHDLRNPLSVIQGCLDILQVSLAKKSLVRSVEILDVAQRGTRRLMSLVQSLLEAAHREESGIWLEQRPVDLSRLLQTATDSMQTAAEQCDIGLVLELPPSSPTIQGDATQLERVMVNLLDNALSYTPAGGSVVIAAVRGENEVEVSVTDTGVGVLPEHREHIFERFARVPGTQGRRRGFGLGLYLCCQVVKAHGGRIWVEPGPGNVGSRFVFTLPNPD